jgi:hypothetical protein
VRARIHEKVFVHETPSVFLLLSLMIFLFAKREGGGRKRGNFLLKIEKNKKKKEKWERRVKIEK